MLLSRSSLPLRTGLQACVASTSKQGFATSSTFRAEEIPSTSSLPGTQVGSGEESSAIQLENKGNAFPTSRGDERGGGRRRGGPIPPPYPEWIKGEGRMYEDAPPGQGPFWIGSTPFPLNPSFDPSPPISQIQKKKIWSLHVSDPKNTIRVLSGKFGISMERMHAILRLQALESEWSKQVS
jgi:hypothetical protein